jgi:hypothetical protein
MYISRSEMARAWPSRRWFILDPSVDGERSARRQPA